jgi:hypothetical protein
MAWLVLCKNCLTPFSVTKDCVETHVPQCVGELALACALCGWVGQYQACDLQPMTADAITPFEPPQLGAAD